MEKNAVFSNDRKYRYTLWRKWGGLFASGYAMFIGLNPSTADENQDDPTIRRCISYARDWGYTGLCMTNLFAFRATLPIFMKAQNDPIGPNNDRWLVEMAKDAGVIVAAWGVEGCHLKRDEAIKRLISGLSYIILTKNGSPGHPLYLSKGLKPIQWNMNNQKIHSTEKSG